LVAQRLAQGLLTFGSGSVAAMFQAVLQRKVRVLLGHAATALLQSGGGVTGVCCQGPQGRMELPGAVIVTTGAATEAATV